MQSGQLTEYSGVVGRLVREAIGLHTLASGFAIGVVFVVFGFMLAMTGAPNVAMPLMQMLMAMILARFALNGLFGEWRGTVLSTSGGSWGQVFGIALRYMVLTALWAVPLMLFGFRADAMVGGAALGPAMLSPKLAALGMLYSIGAMLTPPVFLIVAVAAGDFGDIFSPDHWRRLFGGRWTDLTLVYVIYLGALMLFALLAIPLAIAALALNQWLGALTLAAAGVFLIGAASDLLGRLCGFFAFGETGFVPAEETGVGSFDPTDSAEQFDAPVDTPTGGKPPLEDAAAPVAQARAVFAERPEDAIRQLEALRESHAPHPQVLHALSLMRTESGHLDAAAEVGREAIEISLQRGSPLLAAEVVRALWHRIGQLRPTREQLLAVATASVGKGDLNLPAKIYGLLIKNDASDTKAIKGMMKIAERLHKELNSPQQAIKVYSFLAAECPDSPLAEYFRTGLEEARQSAA